ncbi:BQ2448_4255 [Microbotryum intermedium]|uniref:BQ2448_4255 protein n=1 Tax=Microbotryum intermedium TaxID=269621 RepID=A0A238FNE5_9BASI|nr:BQ2448_4255 [Microbotryum intermedium]
MGGSQLTALKSTLRDSGLSRTSNPKDQRKKRRQTKALSSTSLAHRRSQLDAIAHHFNQFDRTDDKVKFHVVTSKGEMEKRPGGAPTKSRTAGIQVRNKTLLPLLEARSHVSTFVDRRFGEHSTDLTPDEKALTRFTAERQARLDQPLPSFSREKGKRKKARFNLDEEEEHSAEEQGVELTHGGRKLGFGDEEELEHGGWGGLGAALQGGASSSNREPLLRRRMAAGMTETQAHDDEGEEREGEGEGGRKLTHAEIMEQVVAKSKMYKHERQRIKSADDEMRHELDQELKDLRVLLGGTGRMPKPAVVKEAEAATGEKDVEADEHQEDEDEEGQDEHHDDEDEDDEDEDDEDDEDDDDEDDDDEDDEDDDDDESGSESDGSTYSLNDEELEAALAASKKPGGVDRELLRKLIGGKSDESESEAEEEAASAPAEKGRLAPAPVYDLGDVDSSRPAAAAPAEKDNADPYDSYVRMLALEPRGKPSDRLKTPLELAQEAADELKKREDKRLKRQRGEDDESDGEQGGEGKKKANKRVPQADDLEDDYLGDMADGSDGGFQSDEEGIGKGLGEEENIAFDVSDEEGEDDDEEGSDDEDDEDDEEEDEDLDAVDFDEEPEFDEDDDENKIESLVKTLPPKPKQRPDANSVKRELPFAFPCPSTHAEFVKLLASSGVEEAETATVVKRIRTLYHPGLGPSNKEKLQVFTHVLIDHALYLASTPSSTAFTTINSILPSLLTLSHAYPLTTAPYYVNKLTTMQKNFVRGVSRGPLDPTSTTWPGPAELTLLRLIGMTWSTSDLSHPVVAPAMLLISQYLAQARIRSLRDIAAGLFLCTLANQYEALSKRLVPEALIFLQTSLVVLLPTGFTVKNVPGTFPLLDFGQEHVKSLRLGSKASAKVVSEGMGSPMLHFFKALTEIEDDDAQAKVDLVLVAVGLLTSFAEMYVVGIDAFIELFEPVQQIVSKALTKSLPKSLQVSQDPLYRLLQTSLKRMLNLSRTSRHPLTLQHHKPIPIATYIPKFDEGFNPNRRFDPDTERNEANKLRSLVNKEKKGAIRELRKDNRFLAGEEAKKKKEKDLAYEAKIKKIMVGLADERAEEKKEKGIKEHGKKMDKARRGGRR